MTAQKNLRYNLIDLIVHDLKSSMARTKLIFNQMKVEKLPPKYDETLKNLISENNEIYYYVGEILKILHLELEEVHLWIEPTDINEIIESTISQLTPFAKGKGVRIQKQLEPTFLIEIDSTLIKKVILNIIENAIKYSKGGEHINIQTTVESHCVNIEIVDEGMGMNEVDQKRAFDKFYRSPQYVGHTKGSGLGLYLAKYFVELHGGRIFLESREGHGTRVHIHLPNQPNAALDPS